MAVPQYLHEDVLRKHLTALGGKVDRGVAFVGLKQDSDGVTVDLHETIEAGEARTIQEKYSWVVGADGARSEWCGIEDMGFLWI